MSKYNKQSKHEKKQQAEKEHYKKSEIIDIILGELLKKINLKDIIEEQINEDFKNLKKHDSFKSIVFGTPSCSGSIDFNCNKKPISMEETKNIEITLDYDLLKNIYKGENKHE